jgi:hypothetical protein
MLPSTLGPAHRTTPDHTCFGLMAAMRGEEHPPRIVRGIAASPELAVTLSEALWYHLRRQAAAAGVTIELLVAGLVCDTIEGIADWPRPCPVRGHARPRPRRRRGGRPGLPAGRPTKEFP